MTKWCFHHFLMSSMWVFLFWMNSSVPFINRCVTCIYCFISHECLIYLNSGINEKGMQTHCAPPDGAPRVTLRTRKQRPTGGFLRNRGNDLPFRSAQLALHLFCKEPTMTCTLQFKFNLCCLLFKMTQCLQHLPGGCWIRLAKFLWNWVFPCYGRWGV